MTVTKVDLALALALEPLISRARTDVTAIKGPNGMAWTREALTAVRVKRHLDGTMPRGVCPIKAGESTTRIAVFDLDSHKGVVTWASMLGVVGRLVELLEHQGLHPVVFRSSGGNGVHVYLVWDEPQDAYSVRQALTQVLGVMGFRNGAKGVQHSQIEVFPKQDSVPEHGFGNQFILPLAGKSAPLEPLFDYEVMPREYALDLVWKPSAPVPVVEKPVREVVTTQTVEHSQLQAALDAIPNDTDPLGYDEWRDVVSGIHHATHGSEEGYQLALAFSSRAPHFEQDELDLKVWAWLDNKTDAANPITEKTVFATARRYGWVDVSADDFEDLTPTAPAEKVELPLPGFQRDGNGKIEATVGNVRAALLRPDVSGMDIRFDAFRAEIVFADPERPGQWMPFKDQHYFDLRFTLERLGFKPVGRELIRDAVHWLASIQEIDTAQVWLGGLKWDGVPRVDRFLTRYFNTEDSPYATAVSRYAWTAMAGRVLVPGIKADMAVILTGEQGQRKSSGIEALAPFDTFREMNFNQPEEARARLMRGCLVVELGELSGLKTRAVEEIKAWTSRRKEDWTPKYQEFAVSLLRRCLFWGTSNPTEVLDDPTGARRWLPLESGRVRVEDIARDRDQLWAEARVLFEQGGVAWEEAERLARDVHERFTVDADSWEDALRTWLETPDIGGVKPSSEPFRTRDALVGIGLPDRAIKRVDETRCARALRAIGYEQKVARFKTGKPGRWWFDTLCNDLA